jgi:hypothetical protein
MERTSCKMAPNVAFQKSINCPSSNTLFLFRRGVLIVDSQRGIAAHLGKCDFCRAEVRLLAHFNPGERDCQAPAMPLHLRMLAEALLSPLAQFESKGEATPLVFTATLPARTV